MIKKKICLLGSFSVGKTSLVRQYVESIFSEKYHTTIGVKIDKKQLRRKGKDIHLIIWDIQGEDDVHKIKSSYLTGVSGYLMVVDGTRRETLETGYNLHNRISKKFVNLPFILLLNKIDLVNEWQINDGDITELRKKKWAVVETSAKTGKGVEKAFNQLVDKLIPHQGSHKKNPIF